MTVRILRINLGSMNQSNLSHPMIWTTNFTGNLDGSGNYSNSFTASAGRDVFFRFRLP
jgi:hypothetical protein